MKTAVSGKKEIAEEPLPSASNRTRSGVDRSRSRPRHTRMRESVLDPKAGQYIELECAPFTPRPSELMPKVLKGTDLPLKEAVSKVFGWWQFDHRDIEGARWNDARSTIEANIKKLYESGAIRAGSWGAATTAFATKSDSLE